MPVLANIKGLHPINHPRRNGIIIARDSAFSIF
jgi:hypothetical protein